MRVRRAFTLIELLVVVAVIVLLVAILLPALGHARHSARLLRCESNLRGQAQVLQMYIDQAGEAMPPRLVRWNRRLEDGTFEESAWTLARTLAAFSGEAFSHDGQSLYAPTGVWRCPAISTGDDGRYSSHFAVVHSAPNQWLYNFATIDDESGQKVFSADTLDGWERCGAGWRRLSLFARPGDTIAFTDAVTFWFALHRHWHAREMVGRSWQIQEGTDAGNQASHAPLARLPAAYLDGHVAAMPTGREFWESGARVFQAPEGSGPVTLFEPEYRNLMWFLD